MNVTPHGIVGALVLAGLTACSQPHSDVVATSTEDTGDYAMVTTRSGDALNARLCVADPPHADAVADRVLHQLYGRGYRSITIDVYRPGGTIKRLVWTNGVRREEPLAGEAPADLCHETT